MEISKFWLLVAVLTNCLSLGFTFDCSSVTDRLSCKQLKECSWNQDLCSGTFSPTCSQSECYYIDPIRGSDLQDGSVQTPFKTLTQGFEMLKRKDGSLTVINYNSKPDAEIVRPIEIVSSITIKPLFNESSFVISLTNFNTFTASHENNAITMREGGVLQIIGATINSATVEASVNTIFQVSNARLFFHNVSIFEDVGEVNLVNANNSSEFSFTGGNHSGSSFLFNLLAGIYSLSKVEFNNIKAENVLFNVVQSNLTLSQVDVKKGNALFLSLSGSRTNFTAQNITFREYSGNFLKADKIQNFKLSLSKFVDLDLFNSTPFISVQQPSSVSLASLLFQNITIKNSLMLFQDVEVPASATKITMNTIKKKSSSLLLQTSEDIELKSIWAGGVCLLSKNVRWEVSECNFSNINSHCLGFKDSIIYLQYSTFNNSALIIDSNSIGALNADDNINGVSWILFDGGKTGAGTLEINYCEFIENKIPPNFGGAIRFTGRSFGKFSFKQNKMIKNSALYGGAIYSENPFLIIFIIQDSFINNTAKYGGAIYKVSSSSKYPDYKKATLLIGEATFLENKASIKGGSIFARKENLGIARVLFNRNQARYGGAIYYAEIQNLSVVKKISLTDTTFDSNSAQYFGAEMILFVPLDILNNGYYDRLTLINNTDPENLTTLAEKIASSRFSFYNISSEENEIHENDDNLHELVKNETKTSLLYSFNSTDNSTHDLILRHKSGHALNQIITIEILDERNKSAHFVNESGVNIEIIATQNNVSTLQAYLKTSPIEILFQNGIIYIKNRLVIFGQPKTTATLRFQGFDTEFGFFSDNSFVLNKTIQVYFEDCQLGDTYNPTTTACTTCPEGSYSLSDPYKNRFCIPCNNQVASCFGGSKIAPRPGFWRYNITSDKILACPINKACGGGDRNEPQGECNSPYEGNLCNQCTTGYARDSSSKKCVKCRGNVFYYVKAALLFIAQIIMTLFALISSLKKTGATQSAAKIQAKFEKQEAFNNSILRIAFSYLQIWEIIAQLNISWPDWVFEAITYLNGISPGGQGGFSPNCIIKLFRDNDRDVYFIQFVITLIKPFLYWISLVCVYLFYLVCTRKLSQSYGKFKKNLKIFFLIPAYMCQPSIIKATFTLFRCQNFSSDESPVYFLLDETEVQCWTKFHVLWSVAVGLPNLILWTIVFPLLLFKAISKDVKIKKGSNHKEGEYSFIYTGLKRERFYWEFVIMIRKVLFIVILVFFNMISTETQVLALFGLLYIFLSIQYKSWPFEDRRLNFLEMFSLLCLTTGAFSGTSLLYEGNAWLNDVLVFSALLLNLVFLLILTFYFIKNYKEIAKRKIKDIIYFSKKKQDDSKNMTDPKSPSILRKLTKSLFSQSKKVPSFLNSEPAETPKAFDEVTNLKFPNLSSKVLGLKEDQPQSELQ